MLTTIVAGVFVLGVVVLVHEFGHFIVAKLSGVFVKTFSIGFGKKILKWRKNETVYALSVLPFGGYVKFAGETEYYDEVEDSSQQEDENDKKPDPSDEVPDSEIPRERYFTSKPTAIRAAVLFAGPFMNYVLAVLLYIGLTFVQGTQVYPTTTIGQIAEGSAADSVGFEPGDRILSIDGVAVSDWGDVVDALYEDKTAVKQVVAERNDSTIEISCLGRTEDGVYRIGIMAFVPPLIGRVKMDSPAYNAGIREGAVIESINDTTVTEWTDMQRIIYANPDNPLYIRWTLDGIAHADSITPDAVRVPQSGAMDEYTVIGQIRLEPSFLTRRVSLPASVVRGFSAANEMIVRIVTYLGMYFTGEIGIETLGGPILITQMAGDVARWGFDRLLMFLAFFSVNLCIFNLLPLLPFDGGHLVLLGYEAIVRRPVNRKLRDIFAQAGFILIILLMVGVVILDLSRCSGSSPGLF